VPRGEDGEGLSQVLEVALPRFHQGVEAFLEEAVGVLEVERREGDGLIALVALGEDLEPKPDKYVME
jgi:hypothetical protein